MSFVAVAVTGLSAFSQYEQGQYAAGQSRLQAKQADFQAQIENDAAMKTAEIIRRAGRRQAGAANAAYAAAGVKVGQGSAAEVEQDIYQNSEQDAFQALLEGSRRARGLRTNATLMRADAQQQSAAGVVNAVATAIGGYTDYQRAKGWKTRVE